MLIPMSGVPIVSQSGSNCAAADVPKNVYCILQIYQIAARWRERESLTLHLHHIASSLLRPFRPTKSAPTEAIRPSRPGSRRRAPTTAAATAPAAAFDDFKVARVAVPWPVRRRCHSDTRGSPTASCGSAAADPHGSAVRSSS